MFTSALEIFMKKRLPSHLRHILKYNKYQGLEQYLAGITIIKAFAKKSLRMNPKNLRGKLGPCRIK
jgi:hypothetical protein